MDQYAVLEVEKDASSEEIKKVYQEKVAELSPQAEASAEAAQKLAQIQNAFEVLKDEESRQLYDTYGVEPTLSYRLLTPEVFYIRIEKISPTTFAELERVTKKVDQGEALDSLILDLRGNIGGSVDVLPYLLGPFIGQNNYAYQFLHQGQTIDYQTRVGWLPSLVRYKKVVILVDGQTQSSAEIVAAALKKYNVGILVGEKTRGWGTIEKVFPLETQIDEKEKYSVFLVHSLTLRDDGQPIEGNGVEPVVDISQADWQDQLYRYLPSPPLIKAVAQVLEEK
jgi:C-terminal processing protease CtpA/Prc